MPELLETILLCNKCTYYSSLNDLNSLFVFIKMKFSIKHFFSKCDQIRNLLRIWSHLLKKSLMENFIFCKVSEMLKKTKIKKIKAACLAPVLVFLIFKLYPLIVPLYSRVLNRRGGRNKRGCWQISAKLINRETVINREVGKNLQR